jgi:tetratricopeptide (TPR) repeat protein
MNTRQRAFALLLAAFCTLGTTGILAAPTTGLKATDVPVDQGDDFLPEKFVPKVPRSKEMQERLDALSWYMTGRIREGRKDFRGAYDAYRRAAELDPNAAPVFRELVRLAFGLNLTDEGIRYGLRAVELDPSDVQLLQRLALHLAARSKFSEAIRLFEQAAGAKTIDKQSGNYVMIQRSLGLLYATVGEKKKAADAFEIVFDALQNPSKFHLNLPTRTQLMKDPSTTYEQIGQAFLDAERPLRAIKAFELAGKARRGKPGILSYNLARVYFQTKQYDKALEELQKYFDAQLQSKGRAAYELLAEILKATERQDELVRRLVELAEKDKFNSQLQYFLAEQYVAAKQFEKAEALYRKVLAESNDPQGFIGLAAVYRLKKQPGDLLDVLSKAFQASTPQSAQALQGEMQRIAEDKEVVKQLVETGRKRSQAKPPELDYAGAVLLAQIAADAKENDAVVEFYRFALAQDKSRAAVIYEQLGRHLLLTEEFAEAAKVFREAADQAGLENIKPNMLFLLSQALEMDGQTDAAIEAIQDAKKIIPDAGLLHFQEGWIYYHARRWDDAIRVFERVIAQFERTDKETVRRCQFSLSNIYVQTDRRRKGEEILEKILAEDPDDPSVNNDLGYLYAENGKNLEKAEKMIRIAVEAEPENGAYLDSMGWVLYMRGKYKEALTYLLKASETERGADATILDHLGDCHIKLDEKSKAVASWRKALKFAREESHPDEKLIKTIEKKLKDNETPDGDAPAKDK